MGKIKIAIAKTLYDLNCTDGEELKIEALAKKLNQRVNQMSLSTGRIDDQKLLMLTALAMEEIIEDLPATAKHQPLTTSTNNEQAVIALERLVVKLENLAN